MEPTTPPSARGRFLWYDLLTPDPAAARAFYTDVVGWGTQSWQPPDGGALPDDASAEMATYEMWTAGETPIGGVMTSSDSAGSAPPHWLLYIGTDDVDATVAEVEAAGGMVVTPPREIPTVGRFAICRDPQGAVFAPYEPASPAPAPAEEPQPGSISWHELSTGDLAGAWAFYTRVFGWDSAGANDMGEWGTYQEFDAGGRPLGGMYQAGPGAEVPSAWMPYVLVSGLDAAAERVRAGGGTVVNGPMEVPGGDRVAMCLDPTGASVGLHEPPAR